MHRKLLGQFPDRVKLITTRLSRDEAVAYIADLLLCRTPPFHPDDYLGGGYQILSDAMCVGKEAVENYACKGRRTLPHP